MRKPAIRQSFQITANGNMIGGNTNSPAAAQAAARGASARRSTAYSPSRNASDWTSSIPNAPANHHSITFHSRFIAGGWPSV